MKEYKISYEDYLEAQKLHFGYKQIIVYGTSLVLGTAIGLMPALFSKSMGGSFEVTPTFLVIVFLGMFVLAPLTIWYRRNKVYRKNYDSQKSLHETATVTFNDDNIKFESVNGHYQIAWQDIYKYKANEKLILVYDGANMMRPVPTRAFEDNKEKDLFWEKLKKGMMLK